MGEMFFGADYRELCAYPWCDERVEDDEEYCEDHLSDPFEVEVWNERE